jgi:ATP-dependent DNA helicase RecQ
LRVGGTPFYANYRFKPLMDSKTILSYFEGERCSFISAILSRAQKARLWFTIDLEDTAQFTHSHRQRVVKALDYLGEQKMLEVQSSGMRLRYSHTVKTVIVDTLASQLHQRMLDREQFELARLQEMLAFSQASHCLANTLSGHFGESHLKPCGQCSHCLEPHHDHVVNRPIRSRTNIELPAEISELLKQHPDLLTEPRILTRFLCGISSPQLGRAKLAKHSLFGYCAKQPFTEVLDSASKMIQAKFTSGVI